MCGPLSPRNLASAGSIFLICVSPAAAGIHGVQLSFRPGIFQLVEELRIGDELFVPPHADGIEVLQAQSNEIEAGMAGSALRFLLVQLYERPNTRQWIVGGSD